MGELKEFLGEDVVQGRACIESISIRLWSKELGTRVKDSAKNDASKRVGGGGVGKKGRKSLQTNPGILKPPTFHAWVRTLAFDAVISCHKLTNKIFGLLWRGNELLRTLVEPK